MASSGSTYDAPHHRSSATSVRSGVTAGRVALVLVGFLLGITVSLLFLSPVRRPPTRPPLPSVVTRRKNTPPVLPLTHEEGDLPTAARSEEGESSSPPPKRGISGVGRRATVVGRTDDDVQDKGAPGADDDVDRRVRNGGTTVSDGTAAGDGGGDDGVPPTTAASPAESAGAADTSMKALYADTAEAIVALAKSRAIADTIMLIPVNDGYLDFGLNLLCSLGNLTSARSGGASVSHEKNLVATPPPSPPPSAMLAAMLHIDSRLRRVGRGYLFVAMDPIVAMKLKSLGLPTVADPDVPFVSSASAAWADPKFHKLVCTKLYAVRRMLRAGLTVVLSDADIVYRKDFWPYVRVVDGSSSPSSVPSELADQLNFMSSSRATNHQRDAAVETGVGDARLDVMWSIGSCHRDLPDNFQLGSGDGLAKINTGFYAMRASSATVSLVTKAVEHCSRAELTGDQPAINAVLEEERRNRPQRASSHEEGGSQATAASASRTGGYGFFDGCLFANGCIYFKHLCKGLIMPDPKLPRRVRDGIRQRLGPAYFSGKAIAKAKEGDAHQRGSVEAGDGEAAQGRREAAHGGNTPRHGEERVTEGDPLPRRSPFLPAGVIARDDPVMVHANFLVGKKDKIKHLTKYGLWDDACIARWREPLLK